MLRKLNTKRTGFTLVEIMIVVAIIALLAAIAVPNWLRGRKRSQANMTIEELRLVDIAADQYALAAKEPGVIPKWMDVQAYLKPGTRLYSSGGVDILGHAITLPVGTRHAKVSSATVEAFADVTKDTPAAASFWSPYN
ncbi:MAG: prepilin-type N-terminal cleavage/methylation domain-containing protein [bacterium]